VRILHVANFSQKKNGAVFYDVPRKLNNGFIRNGHLVYEFSDRDIARASTLFQSRKFGIPAANKRLIETCENFQPDIIFLGHADVIWGRTLKAIRKKFPNVPIAQWNVDGVFLEDNRKRVLRKCEYVDATFITSAGDALKEFVHEHSIVSFFPNPVDDSIEVGRGFERDDQQNDLFYCVGNPDLKREFGDCALTAHELATTLQERLPETKFDFHGMAGIPGIWGAQYLEAVNKAKMGLNLSRGFSNYLYSSDRMAQLMGNGLLTFVDRATSFQELFNEDDLAFYDNFADLTARINFFKQNEDERKRVAENGWRKSHERFNSTRIAKYLIETTMRTSYTEDYEWLRHRYTR